MRWFDEYFWVFILLAIGLGFFVPSVGLALKPFVLYLLILLMIFSTLKINVREVLDDLKNLKEEAAILLIVFIITPLLVLLLRPWLDPQLYLGFIIIAAVPCGISVVFLSTLFGGDGAQALTITGLAHLAAPIITPLLVEIFAGAQVEVSFWAMVWLIVQLVLFPLIIAQLLRIKRPIFNAVSSLSKPASYILLFLILWGVTSPTREFVIRQPVLAMGTFMFSVAVICAVFILGYLLAKDYRDQITLAICSSYKNFTLATVIAITLFSDIVALPAIMWTIANNVLLIPVTLLALTKEHQKK